MLHQINVVFIFCIKQHICLNNVPILCGCSRTYICMLYFMALFILTSHTKANKLLKVCVQNSGHSIPCSNGKKIFELNDAVALQKTLERGGRGVQKKGNKYEAASKQKHTALVSNNGQENSNVQILSRKKQSIRFSNRPGRLYLCFCTIFEFVAPHCEEEKRVNGTSNKKTFKEEK